MSSIMTIKDLCLWYGKSQALKNINIEIPEKSITALIGPSGCGKALPEVTLSVWCPQESVEAVGAKQTHAKTGDSIQYISPGSNPDGIFHFIFI